jgi:ubiquitin
MGNKPKIKEPYTGTPKKTKVKIVEMPCDPHDLSPAGDKRAKKQQGKKGTNKNS